MGSITDAIDFTKISETTPISIEKIYDAALSKAHKDLAYFPDSFPSSREVMILLLKYDIIPENKNHFASDLATIQIEEKDWKPNSSISNQSFCGKLCSMFYEVLGFSGPSVH